MNAACDPFVILIPVFNEWPVVSVLLRSIDAVLLENGLRAVAILVDDGSAVPHEGELEAPPEGGDGLAGLAVLRLRRNLGHQRAIAVGLCYLHEHLKSRPVLVMDGDGEDAPDDIPRLVAALEENGGRRIVFAARQRRSESLLFKLFYRVYQLAHLLLTGLGIRFGNFSVIPPRALDRLVVTSEIWNHYAAAVVNSRTEYETLQTQRATRIGGRSKMGFTSLVVHGLSALSVYKHLIGVRLLFGVAALMGLVSTVGLASAVRIGDLGSRWLAVGFAGFTLLLQVLIAAVLFVFLMLAERQSAAFLPARDYRYFVADLSVVQGHVELEEGP